MRQLTLCVDLDISEADLLRAVTEAVAARVGQKVRAVKGTGANGIPVGVALVEKQ